ncbi:uncharacterized protein LOC124484836 [Hypomesus transpacificus]|uniref:uncharacterized protein LOC124484836 n=1 Tax=Hypomesus transpacificus TaxID=137520 RepID=UPI001F0854FD|nr:uncharacterized protein LOC124484836 [Hypomesus transpacificus]
MLTECPQRAAVLFKRSLLAKEVDSEPLKFSLDLRQSVEDRERAIICFYKANTTNWARPLRCWLEGDAAVGEGVNRHVLNLTVHTLQTGFHVNYGNGDVTILFEGQQDHLVPCASQLLLDSDLFLMAGRILGHSVLHGGPVLVGLCPAVVCVLLGDKPDATTITLDDVPDMDLRKIIASLEGQADLSEEEQSAVKQLAESWEIGRQFLTEQTRHWLFHRLLQHAVLGRAAQQIVQLRKGIKQTGVWPLLSTKKATDRLMFPRLADVAISPETILDRIIWPVEKPMEEEEDEPYSLEIRCTVAGYLCQFIETASQKSLRALLRFWTGWEVPTEDLHMEVVHGSHPRSSTCFQSLKLPGNYDNYALFSLSLESCISTCDTGFGLV